MAATFTVEGKVFGQKRPLFADWTIPFPPEWEEAEGDHLTLRALITGIVREEVDAFQARQEQRKMIQTLTHQDIERGLMKGKVDLGGRDLLQGVDPHQAVANALLAFEDGLYYVFIDERQYEKLNQEVFLKPDSRITFLRLVALAGG